MIVFVDIEHESGRTAEHGQQLLAARTWITYRLEDISALPCMLVRDDRISVDLLERLDARAIFLSGNSARPEAYSTESLAALFAILRDGRWPIFGFCGGMQFLAEAWETPVVELAQNDDEPEFEFGYFPVEITERHPIVDGLGDAPNIRPDAR